MSAGKKRGLPKTLKRRSGASGRNLKQRVASAGKRSASSTRWLERQLNDPYVASAKRDGYRSRAAYKLIELDDKYGFFKPGRRVVDLGAAPGGWTQVAVARVGCRDRALVLAVDLLDMDPVPGAMSLQGDFLGNDMGQRIEAAMAGHADVVLSDMAPPATGHKSTDHLKIVALCERAYLFATEILSPGGTFIAKVLKGGTEQELLADMKKAFATVRHAKPNASRAESAESYVIAQGFRPTR